jgi:HAD superfamily hydrolase (TIGR01509 family)
MRPIIFDFGGVLFGWNPVRLLRRAVPERAPDDASARALAVDFFQSYSGDWGDFDRGTVEVADLVQRIARRTGLPASVVQAVVDDVPRELAPIADTVALVQHLHASGHPLFYLSNMPAAFATHLETSHGFMHCFRDGVFSSRVGLIKPEPAIFALAEERFGQAGSELMFLDDHAPNIEAARAAGWNALLFTNAAQAEADLRAAGWLGTAASGTRPAV